MAFVTSTVRSAFDIVLEQKLLGDVITSSLKATFRLYFIIRRKVQPSSKIIEVLKINND